MNNDQFSDWYFRHRGYYANLPFWLQKTGSPEEVLQRWQSMLAGVPFEDAIKASEQMYESDNQPKSYEHHPREIKRRCRQMESDREAKRNFAKMGGVETVACPHCQDTNIVLIVIVRVDGKSISNAHEVLEVALTALREKKRVPAYYATVRCDCRKQRENDHMSQVNRSAQLLWNRSMIKSMQSKEFWDAIEPPPIMGVWNPGDGF